MSPLKTGKSVNQTRNLSDQWQSALTNGYLGSLQQCIRAMEVTVIGSILVAAFGASSALASDTLSRVTDEHLIISQLTMQVQARDEPCKDQKDKKRKDCNKVQEHLGAGLKARDNLPPKPPKGGR